MRAADIEHVRTLPLFREMSPVHFDRLTADAMLQRFPAHVELIQEGDRPDFLHIIVEGLVELYSAREGDELGFSLLRPIRPSSWRLSPATASISIRREPSRRRAS